MAETGPEDDLQTVLIADDEPSLRALVRATIASERYRVVEAVNGDEAWALTRQHRPSVVLLDVQMPGRNGLEVARAIRADPDLARGTRIIMVTARGQPQDVWAAGSAGVDRYLVKPFSPLELLTAVEQALGL